MLNIYALNQSELEHYLTISLKLIELAQMAGINQNNFQSHAQVSIFKFFDNLPFYVDVKVLALFNYFL